MIKSVFFFFLILFFSDVIFSEQADDKISATEEEQSLLASKTKEDASDSGIEIYNLITERCVSKIGRDFYRQFSLRLKEDQLFKSSKANVHVDEKFGPSMMSIISVEITFFISPVLVYSSAVRPRGADIEKEVESAVLAARDFLLNAEKQSQILKEDLAGNGIW
jgi:hypothetical protein